MTRERVNPFDVGTPERILFDRYRKATAAAVASQRYTPSLDWEKVAPGNYAVVVGSKRRFDVFHFATERDAQRFVNASAYAFKRTRAE